MPGYNYRKIDKTCILVPVTCDYIHMINSVGGYLIPINHVGCSEREKEFERRLEALIEEYTREPIENIRGL